MQTPGPSDTPNRLDDRIIATVFSPSVARLIGDMFQRWQESNREAVPARDTIDPFSMQDLLPDVAIMEFVAAKRDWRYALVGERVREMIGGEVKGRMLSDVLAKSGDGARVGKFYQDTALWRWPTITFGQHTVGYATQGTFARLLFPYRRQGDEVDTLLLVLIRLGPDGR